MQRANHDEWDTCSPATPLKIVALEVDGVEVWPQLPAATAGSQLPIALVERLGRIEAALDILVAREVPREWYTIGEFATLVGKAEFTCREWCRLGRVRAAKRKSGRGKHQSWVVSHEELLRYRQEGLLPR